MQPARQVQHGSPHLLLSQPPVKGRELERILPLTAGVCWGLYGHSGTHIVQVLPPGAFPADIHFKAPANFHEPTRSEINRFSQLKRRLSFEITSVCFFFASRLHDTRVRTVGLSVCWQINTTWW